MENQTEYFEQYKDKLYQLLKHCKENVPYYRQNWDFSIPLLSDFTYEFFCTHVPFLSKKVVRDNSEQFLVSGILPEDLSIDSTSGTEGKPIICYRSKKERFQCSHSLWTLRRRFVKDIRPSDRFARFYAFRNTDSQVVANTVLFRDNDILLPLFDLTDEKLIYYWNEIVRFKPRWLHGPSSTIYNMALVVKNYHLQPFRFAFIELSGEYVQKEHQMLIEEVFQCKTANQYGCREYWPMAYSDYDGRLRLVTENIFIEQVKSMGHDQNELIITLLKNDTWPLVRYRLEDLGSYVFDSSGIYLTLQRGRKADFFMMKGNRRFNAIVFSGLARAVCELYGGNAILQFQITKVSDEQLNVKLRLNQEFHKEEVMMRYKRELQNVLGDAVDIQVTETDYIEPDARNGKTREFIDATR